MLDDDNLVPQTGALLACVSDGPNVNKGGGAPVFLRTSVLLMPIMEAIIGWKIMLDKAGGNFV